MRVVYSKKFISEYKKLPKEVRLLSIKREKIFKNNPFDPQLKTHKLTGRLKGNSAFSINYKYRIIFSVEENNEFWFVSVGTHDIYKN